MVKSAALEYKIVKMIAISTLFKLSTKATFRKDINRPDNVLLLVA